MNFERHRFTKFGVLFPVSLTGSDLASTRTMSNSLALKSAHSDSPDSLQAFALKPVFLIFPEPSSTLQSSGF